MTELTGFGYDKKQKIYDDREAVVNVKGSSSRPKCGCGSWINHWLLYTGNMDKGVTNPKCVYMGCSSPSEDGAHVQEVNWKRNAEGKIETRPKGKIYIVPMCKKHNASKFEEPFFIHKDRWMIDDTARDQCKTVTYIQNKNNYFNMKVVASAAQPRCGCKTFLDHYRASASSSRRVCVALPCSAEAVVALPMVSTDGRTDMEKWFAPLCATHAKSREPFWVKRQATLVTKDKQPTCGR